jgi:hypothetical protein
VTQRNQPPANPARFNPRCAGKVDHRLIDILIIAVCAIKSAVDERCHLKIRAAEVRLAKVWLNVRIYHPPRIPDIHSPLDLDNVFFIGDAAPLIAGMAFIVAEGIKPVNICLGPYAETDFHWIVQLVRKWPFRADGWRCKGTPIFAVRKTCL